MSADGHFYPPAGKLQMFDDWDGSGEDGKRIINEYKSVGGHLTGVGRTLGGNNTDIFPICLLDLLYSSIFAVIHQFFICASSVYCPIVIRTFWMDKCIFCSNLPRIDTDNKFLYVFYLFFIRQVCVTAP